LAGVRDHADEDADFGLPSDGVLHTDYEAPTPTTVPGARTIRTLDLAKLIEQRQPLMLDTSASGVSIPGAVALWGAGICGGTSDEYQQRLARKMQQLTGGDRTVPIVTVGFNSERSQGHNLALRLVALGYTNAMRPGRLRACQMPNWQCKTGNAAATALSAAVPELLDGLLKVEQPVSRSPAASPTQKDRHDTIRPVRKQFIVAGAGLLSSDAPRFISSMLDAEGPVDAVAPGFASQAV
jgi:hypothetical protein